MPCIFMGAGGIAGPAIANISLTESMMTLFSRISAAAATAIAAATITASAFAEALPRPEGQTLLSISGQIDNTNAEGAAHFDLAMIDALPLRETVTTTPWYEGPQRFSGPLLSDLMAAIGASGSALRIIAINDYAATMPWTDIESVPVILAVRHNGETMSVRDKGPLFVIYPFDEYPELHDEVYFSRSVWQVAAIEVLP